MARPILVAELGRGGMADVFLALRRGMGGFAKLLVIKRMREGAIEGHAIAMFHDEARISARLNHPNIVQTYEVGFDGEHYRLEMEYLDGQPLHRIESRARRAGRAISPAVAVCITRAVLAGLHHAHELCDFDGTPLDIVHRDVSPQNVFVTYDGSVKVVDFGIAKVAGQLAVTRIGMVKGKIRYMAPEQATSGLVDRRADIFATGIVLWQLLTGKRYWGDADEALVYARLARGDLPPSPRQVAPGVSAALNAICARALAYDPQDRYATAAEFACALEDCGRIADGTSRAFGALVAELFADLQAEIRAAIQEAAARPQTEGTPVTSLPALTASSSSSELQVVPPATSDAPVTQTPRLPEGSRRSNALLAGAAGAIAAAVVVVVVVVVASFAAGGPARGHAGGGAPRSGGTAPALGSSLPPPHREGPEGSHGPATRPGGSANFRLDDRDPRDGGASRPQPAR